MQQNSDKWLEWRRNGIGASDAPIIMGVSPWKTPFQLWEEKLGFTKSEGNYATQRGHDLEPKARAMFELEMGKEFPPTLATHQEYPWLRASLDGFHKEDDEILEIKCPGEEDHKLAKEGKVPEKYYPQLQHQLLVTGASVVYYYSFDGESGVSVPVGINLSYIKDMFIKLQNFWEYVVYQKEPPLTDRDQIVIEDTDLVNLATSYAEMDDQMKKIKKDMDAIKKQLSENIAHPKAKVGRLTLTKSIRQGAIDYKAIPELQGRDLSEYKKDPTPVFTVRVNKK